MATDPDRLTGFGREVARDRPLDALRGTLRRAWAALEYSSAYLALVAAAEVLVVTYLLSLSPSLAPVVIALITYAVYTNDRLIDLETDGVSNPDRTAFVRRHERTLYVSAAAAYGLGAALAALGGPLAFAIALLPGGAWLVYAVDWIRVPSVGVGRLKEIPVASSLVVSVAWALAVVLLPVGFAGVALSPTVGVVLVYFALVAFVSVEVANVRDVESDLENDVATMATALGVARTRAGLYGVSLVAVGVLGLAVLSGLVVASSAAVLSLGIAVLVVVTGLVGRADDRRLTLAAECSRLPVFVVLTVMVAL
jgi:hypothetical protein